MRHLFLLIATATLTMAGWKENTLAAVLMAEAAGEGRAGMEAVTEVLLNRAREQNRSLESVILKRGTVSCLNNTTPTKLYVKWLRSDPRTMKVAMEVARTAFSNPRAIPVRVHGATYYDHKRRPKARSWPDDLVVVAVIGNHRFWKELN